MINRWATRQANNLAARFTAVHRLLAIENPAGMDRVNHGGFDFPYPLSPAFIHSMCIAHALRFLKDCLVK